jgi:5'-nucleotidase
VREPETLVVAVSSRALFELEGEARVFRKDGLAAFAARQRELEEVPLAPGPAFSLVSELMGLNALAPPGTDRFVDVIVVSGQHPDTGLRILRSISHHGLGIERAAFTGGALIAPYLEAFGAGLVLSRSPEDGQAAVELGIAAAVMYDLPKNWIRRKGPIRIAFDGDAVIFDGESEAIYKSMGFAAFMKNETNLARHPMSEGPHGRFLRGLQRIRRAVPDAMRVALVTARGAPAHERALRTLRSSCRDFPKPLSSRPSAPTSSSTIRNTISDPRPCTSRPAGSRRGQPERRSERAASEKRRLETLEFPRSLAARPNQAMTDPQAGTEFGAHAPASLPRPTFGKAPCLDFVVRTRGEIDRPDRNDTDQKGPAGPVLALEKPDEVTRDDVLPCGVPRPP